MVDVNITLFIQMAHFLFAFWLMRRYLWEPVVRAIDTQRKQREKLEAQLAEQRELFEQKQAAIDRLWLDAQHAFVTHTPALKHETCFDTRVEHEPLPTSTVPVEALVKTVAADLAQKAQLHD